MTAFLGAFAASFVVSALALGIATRFTDGIRAKGKLGYVVPPLVFAALETLFGGLLTWILTIALGLLTAGLGFLLGFVVRIFVRAWLIRRTAALTQRLEVDRFGVALKLSLLIGILAFVAEHAVRLALS